MRNFIFSFILIAFSALSLPAFAQNYAEPAGLWLTESKRAVIEVKECDQGLCGTVFWIIKDGMQRDEHNPDEAKRNTPMCGLPIMWGFKQENAHNWIDGTIYKADEGDTYHASLQMLPSGNMLVRGYVGMPLFGKSQVWTPVTAEAYPPCRH